MAKKRRKKSKGTRSKGNKNKRFTTIAVTLICVVGIFLIFVLSREGDFLSNLEQVWQTTIDNLSGYQTVERKAEQLANLEAHADEMIVYAVDTGNSDCLIMRTPEGNSMLVDAADNDDFKNISGTLKALGIEKLDVAVATHADADHIGSMDDVIEHFLPNVVYMPALGKRTATYQNLQRAIEETDTKQVYATAPLQFALGSVEVTVLNPQNTNYKDVNDTSIVLLLQYGDKRVLLTGDIETQAMADIMVLYPEYVDVDVLKIAHHGSARSTTQKWLDATTPEVAIITVGKDNDYGHPHKETIDKLNKNGIVTLRTDEDGDVAVFVGTDSVAYAVAA